MKSLPLVSVITITFNSENYIKSCIESVKNQTYLNVEHIIVDAGSGDRTLEIIKESAIDNLAAYRIPFCNPAVARDCGIKRSNGKYISILDSDDIFVLDKIKLQVEFLESTTNYAAVGSGLYFQESNKIREVVPKVDQSDLKNLLMLGLSVIPHSSIMFSRSAYIASGGYSTYMNYVEDFSLILRLARVGDLGLIEMPLVLYRSHKNSLSRARNRDDDHRFQILALLENQIFPEKMKPPLVAELVNLDKGWINHLYYRIIFCRLLIGIKQIQSFEKKLLGIKFFIQQLLKAPYSSFKATSKAPISLELRDQLDSLGRSL